MKIARVVGNVVSTVKESTHYGYKLMLVQFLNSKLEPVGQKQLAFDAANAGIGDIVLINQDGGAAKEILHNKDIIADITICGVLDEMYMEDCNKVIKF